MRLVLDKTSAVDPIGQRFGTLGTYSYFRTPITPLLPTMNRLMIYGSTGYTGRLALAYAKSLDLDIVIAGRTEDKVRSLAAELDFRYRTFDLSKHRDIVTALQDVQVLLNCSGPFKYTARPLISACIEGGTHYLDIAAELDSYQISMNLDRAAKKANVVLMPGCGGSVAMLGCLTRYASKEISSPTSIDIALRVAGPMSHGSLNAAAGSIATQPLKRKDGVMVDQNANDTSFFNFDNGEGSVLCFPVSLPDLITLWVSTGVPNIRTYVHVAGDHSFPQHDSVVDGPTEQQREDHPYYASVTITDKHGDRRSAVLKTVNGYTFTAQLSIHAAKRILDGEGVAGFNTPVGLFGDNFVKDVHGSALRVLH